MGSDVIYGLQNLELSNQETHLDKNRDAVGSHGSSSWGSHKTKLDLEIQQNLSRYRNITLRKDTTALREFMGNRVSEILDTTDVTSGITLDLEIIYLTLVPEIMQLLLIYQTILTGRMEIHG